MKCNECIKLLELYSEKGIDPLEDKNLSLHIDSCLSCKKELEFYDAYFSVLKKNKQKKLPAGFISGVNRKIDAKEHTGVFFRFFEYFRKNFTYFRKYKIPFEAAGVLATVMIFIVIFKPFQSSDMGLHDAKMPSMPVTEEDMESLKAADSDQKLQMEKDEAVYEVKAADNKKIAVDKEPSVKLESSRKRDIFVQSNAVLRAEKDAAVVNQIKEKNSTGTQNLSAVDEYPVNSEENKMVDSTAGAGVFAKKSSRLMTDDKLSASNENTAEDINAYEVVITDNSTVKMSEGDSNSPDGAESIKEEDSVIQGKSKLSFSEQPAEESSSMKKSVKADSSRVYSSTSKNARDLIIKNKGKIVAESFNREKGILDTFLIEIKQSDYVKLIRELQDTQIVQKKPVIKENSNEMIKVWIKIK